MTKIFSYFFLFTFLGIGQSYAQISQKAKEINTDCLKKFATLKPSQQDKSEQGIPYSVFVLREGSTWIVAVTDTGSFYSFRKMRKVDTLTPNSSAFDLNLCKLLEKPERFILKEKPAKIGDLEVPHYYTFNNEGGKRFGAIQQAETGIKNLSALGKGIAFIGSGIAGIFSIFKPTKLLEKVDGLKKQITEQEALAKKQVDEMKKQTDVIKKQADEMKKLQEETAKLKKAQEDAMKENELVKAELKKAQEDAEKAKAPKDNKKTTEGKKEEKKETKKDEKKTEIKKEESKEIKKDEKKEEPKEIKKDEKKEEPKEEQKKEETEPAKITNVTPEEDLSKLSKKERKKRKKEFDKKRKEQEKNNKKEKTQLNLKPYPHLNKENTQNKQEADTTKPTKYNTKDKNIKADTTKPQTQNFTSKKNGGTEDSVQVHIQKTLKNIDALQKKYALEQQKLDFEAQKAELLRKQRELETGKEEKPTKETLTLQSVKQKHLQSLKEKASELDNLLTKIKSSEEDVLKYQVPAIRQKRQELKKEIAIFEQENPTEKSKDKDLD